MALSRKIFFSEPLGQQLKEFRLQYKIKSKDVAFQIGKSTAYVSKLEKGLIRQVKRTDLVAITNFITKTDTGYDLFCEKILSSVSASELDHNASFINFDMIDRRIPITQDCKDLIRNEFLSLSISPAELTDYINSNSDLEPSFFKDHNINKSTLESNVWYGYQEADSLEIGRTFILIKYSSNAISDFLDGKINKCEYLLPYVILYHIFKYKVIQDKSDLSDHDYIFCKNKAEQKLLETGVYSLAVKRRMTEKTESTNELSSFLSSSDIENNKLMAKLFSQISILSTYDVLYTNERLRVIDDNLENGDLSFSFAFMSTPISTLKELNTTSKKEFLLEINELVKKYQSIIESPRNIELF